MWLGTGKLRQSFTGRFFVPPTCPINMTVDPGIPNKYYRDYCTPLLVTRNQQLCCPHAATAGKINLPALQKQEGERPLRAGAVYLAVL